MNEVSNNPPHLVNTNGTLNPYALIPFCAYETDMTLLGQKRKDLVFPACSYFEPTVLEKQLCYSLNLSSFKTNKIAKRDGLMIIIDDGKIYEELKTEIELTLKVSFLLWILKPQDLTK